MAKATRVLSTPRQTAPKIKAKKSAKPSRLPARREASPTGRQLYERALPRMEQIIATLESCFVTDGWHESWESGPMPKWAADVIKYFRARATGARENAAEEAKVNAFVHQCGQSLDWIFAGDPGGLICKAAGNSPQSPSLQSIADRSKAIVAREAAGLADVAEQHLVAQSEEVQS
jgi:hypothetical protein